MATVYRTGVRSASHHAQNLPAANRLARAGQAVPLSSSRMRMRAGYGVRRRRLVRLDALCERTLL
jgi:hypothetical protein